MTDIIELKIGGKIFNGWKTANVTRSLNAMTSSFDLTVSDKYIGQYANIPLNRECKILIGGKPVVTGYLDQISPKYSATSHEVQFSGRSKTCDLVDCSAEVQTGQVLTGTVSELARKLISPFGISLKMSLSSLTTTIPDFQVQPGETVQSAIDRLCKACGLVYTDDENGDLVIQSIGIGMSAGLLVHHTRNGDANNVLSGEATYSARETFSCYTVKAQTQGSDFAGGDDITGIEAKAEDSEVNRYRPLIINAENAMNESMAKKRAEWERSQRRARAFSAEYVVTGWKNSSGSLWAPNSYVMVDDDFIRARGLLLISEVRLTTGTSGTNASLKLSRPDAYITQFNLKGFSGWEELRKGV